MSIQDAKLAVIERTIVGGKTTKGQLIRGMEEGLIRKIGQYVRKHDSMPDFDYLMSEYNDSKHFQQILEKIDISRPDVENVVNRLLRGDVNNYETQADNPDQAKSDKVGRNDPCPCGSGLKFKKCCNV